MFRAGEVVLDFEPRQKAVRMLGHIAYLDRLSGGPGCFARNRHFMYECRNLRGERGKCPTRRAVQIWIAELRRLGLIRIEYPGRGRRVMRVTVLGQKYLGFISMAGCHPEIRHKADDPKENEPLPAGEGTGPVIMPDRACQPGPYRIMRPGARHVRAEESRMPRPQKSRMAGPVRSPKGATRMKNQISQTDRSRPAPFRTPGAPASIRGGELPPAVLENLRGRISPGTIAMIRDAFLGYDGPTLVFRGDLHAYLQTLLRSVQAAPLRFGELQTPEARVS